MRRLGTTFALILATALVVAPLTAFALDGFTDVEPGSTHEASINWLVGTGVTAGCTPTEYCPSNPVTRAQMATFLRRFADNAVTGPVAYAEVATSPGLISSRNISGLSRPETGRYCLEVDLPRGLTRDDVYVQVSVDWSDSLGDDLFAYERSTGLACPAGHIEVDTYGFTTAAGNVTGMERTNRVAFTVTLWEGTPSGPGAAAGAAAGDDRNDG
jgi:hypothetical protein